MGGDGLDAQKQIKKLMEERGWTDYRLAKESGLSHSTVTNMFNRNNAPTLPTLEAVCRAFGITLAQFFSEGNPLELTEEQQILFARWSSLTDRQKNLLLELMDTM
jgi:transcriptional regulator with XRE-family HTH domain